MNSSLSGTQSTKQRSKQTITRHIEIKNSLTVTRWEEGRDNEGKCDKGFQEQL